MTTVTLDAERSEAFAGRLAEVLNDAGLAVMISIGHRTGLFDALAKSGATTSDDLARAAGLHERYVREWLGAMTTGRVVELDPETRLYVLPAEHAAWLTRGAPYNAAVTAQFIPVLATVEDDVVNAFRDGGGVPYERYGRFHEVMAEDSAQSVVAALTDHILPLVPGLTDRLEKGIRVADLGCGRGRALIELARTYPRSTFTGVDLSEDAVAWATDAAAGLENVRFEARSLATFDVDAEPGAYDLVTTFDAVHDQPAPLALLKGIHRSLAKGGVYLMQDIDGHTHHHENLDLPFGTFLYAVSCLHCMTVSLAQGGEGLGTLWGVEKAEELLRVAGFTQLELHRLEHDPVNVYVVARP
ncbi:MAG TPA: class I SAM-dependent methyltransferase [Gaiella sp.]|nr:class I SAM-dependent methyltransferase [Gaiella sp.]